MECATLATSLSPDAVRPQAGADCGAAQQFKEAMQTAERGGDVYVDGPASAHGPSPLADLMTRLESIDFKPPDFKPSSAKAADTATARDDAHHGSRDSGQESPPAETLWDFGEQALAIQAEIFRSTLMMETMNTAKQGVTTLFQQQG